MVKRHVVMIPRDDGVVESSPMKEWLRHHPDCMPTNLDPDPTKSTSHQLRSGLKRMGWSMEETSEEVRLLPPGSLNLLTKLMENDEEHELDAPPTSHFVLETHLRDYLADNLASISVNGAKLKLYEGGKGVEYSTPVGRIDILAEDNSGALYIFELKRADSPDHAIGQLARYMGWAKETIGIDKPVYGVIVANAIGDKIRYARLAIPNVFLFEYKIAFTLNEAHSLLN
jgi:RecB family endonuclease NucS